jgi:NAD(P)-dependent dehydrogenase (short-subunit alcohol dehydrogenase family)
MSVAGRVALVTGAQGGLGMAIAQSLASHGASLVLHDRKDWDSALVSRQFPSGRALPVSGDVRDEDDVDRAVAVTLREFGRIDILINNAGVMSTTSFLELTSADWDAVIDTNLKGYYLFGQRAARAMASLGWGRIVNVASTRQVQAVPGGTAYCVSKAGVAMLTRVMALELAPMGIRVNSIAPGTVLTGLNRDYLSEPAFQAERIAHIPVGRLGRPQDVVAAVDLLVSDAADFMVGACLMVDGGQTLW